MTPVLWSKDAKDAGTLSFRPLFWIHALPFQTMFCNKDMDFVGIHPARDSASMSAMCHDMVSGQCEFLKDPSAGGVVQDMPCLKPVYFGSWN